MRRRDIALGMGLLICTTGLRAQSVQSSGLELLAQKYIDTSGGLTVQEAIARALDLEPAIRAARAQIDAVRGMRLQASLRPNPTVSFMQQGEPSGTDNQTRIEVQWPLDLFRKPGRVAAADREVEAIEKGIADRERQLVAQVRSIYGQLLVALRDLAISEELAAATYRQSALVKARVQQGNAPALEGNMLDVEARRLDADRLLQAGRVESTLLDLKRLLGSSPDEPLRVRDTLDALVATETQAVLEESVVDARPDVQEAEARVRVADAKIDRAERDGRIDVSVFGTYMRMDAGFPQQGFGPGGELERVRGLFHYVAGGAIVAVPLNNRNQGEIATARAERSGAATMLVAVRLTAQTEVAAARARDDYARRAMAAYTESGRTLARQNLDVVRQTYDLGRATVFDVLNEQRRYLDFERTYTATLKEVYEARVALRRALGEVR